MSGYKLHFQNWIKNEGLVYFWESRLNVLCSCPCEGGVAKILYKSPKQSLFPLYGKVVIYNDKIIAIPHAESNILIYDISKDEVRFCSCGITDEIFVQQDGGKFYEGIVRDNILYMIGFWTQYIGVFDMENEVMKKVISIEVENREKPYKGPVMKNAVLFKDELFVTDYSFNWIYRVNLLTSKVSKRVFELSEGGFSDIAIDKDYVWLAPRKATAFLKWNPITDQVEYIGQYPKEYVMSDQANISEICIHKNQLYSVPYRANKVINIDIGTGEIKSCEHINQYYGAIEKRKKEPKYQFVLSDGDYLYTYCNDLRSVIRYNPTLEQVRLIEYVIPWKTLYQDYDMKTFCENDVESFIDSIIEYSENENAQSAHAEHIGKKIFEELVKCDKSAT